MQKVILPNGLKVIYDRKKGNSVVVEVMIKTGSNQELPFERGTAHFLEHMLFEGTKTRPTNLEISNEIEKIGGDLNAYTTNERTCFYVKVLKKHFSKAVEILADILTNPLFNEKHLQKEKNIVIKEIDMIYDEPSYYQWILLQKNIFVKHPCKFPTYGDKRVIKGLTREKIKKYFEKNYVPGNIVISIVGDVSGWKREIKRKFKGFKGKKVIYKKFTEPEAKSSKTKKETKKIVNTYLILGFKTVPRQHNDSYVLDVINGILGRGQSGRMFTEIRSKRGLAYEVGTQNIAEVSFGLFAVHATIDRKNLNKVKKLVMEEIEKLQEINEKNLQEAKDYFEGGYLLDLEDTQKRADQILYWEQVKDAEMITNIVKEVRKITSADVRRVAKKYFKNYTMTILEGK